jgi:hypothetical protein
MGEHAPVCRRVDSVRSASVTRPALFIGAGKPGEVAAGGERRLPEHAFREGRPLAVLTNGREWSFYLPAGQDAYDERLFYKLNLLHKLDLAEREPGRVIEQRTRRFDFERVLRSRQALDDARCDYNGLHGARSSGRASRSLGATRYGPDEVLASVGVKRVTTRERTRPSNGPYFVRYAPLCQQPRTRDPGGDGGALSSGRLDRSRRCTGRKTGAKPILARRCCRYRPCGTRMDMRSEIDPATLKHYEENAAKSPEHGKVYAILCLARAIENHAMMFNHLGQIGYTPDSRAISPLEKLADAAEGIASALSSRNGE